MTPEQCLRSWSSVTRGASLYTNALVPKERLSSEFPRMLAGFLARDLRAFLARFRESDGDGLFAAFYATAFAALAGAQRAALPAAHCTGDSFTCRFAISAS